MATDEDEKNRKRDEPRNEEEAELKLVKKSRGRPKGSLNKKKQLLSSITPHVITVNVGEDVVTKLRTLAASSPSLTILSVDGSVSIVNIRNDESDEIKAHEGLFKILSLSCSIEDDKETMVNVLLSGPESSSQVFGGVARALLPASPIQIILGKFKREIGTSSCSPDENGNSSYQHQLRAPVPAPAPRTRARARQHEHPRPRVRSTPAPVPTPHVLNPTPLRAMPPLTPASSSSYKTTSTSATPTP
ncbi:AT-hook motif nuclear-localized protein 8-like [Humulus lupulus]|uniref:AT-hook motif nuclear-localized protein 8-like n=1 Tax=Humulus lupulus TaxID=3486 RepID=UPI002B40B816|nr:AT-hook motif nuclear-localized protein 8-like [Humulus lupulus]